MWIRSRSWDLFWFHSAVWLNLLLFILVSEKVHEAVYAVGVFLFWIGHRVTSMYLAWGTAAYRPLNHSQRGRFLLIPLGMTASIFLFLTLPQSLTTLTLVERILILALLDFVWGLHHFAAQHYGFLRLYQNISSVASSKFLLYKDRIFAWGVGGLFIFLAELLQGSSILLEENLISSSFLTDNQVFVPFILNTCTGIILMYCLWMLSAAWKNGDRLPKLLYYAGVGAMGIAAFQLHPFVFLMMWTLQHWMASIGLAAHMGGNDVRRGGAEKPEMKKHPFHLMFFRTWWVAFWLCLLSVVCTPFFELEAVSDEARYSQYLVPELMSYLEQSAWLPFLIALGFSSGFVHYWMDRAIYRFSDAETRNSAQQLLFYQSTKI